MNLQDGRHNFNVFDGIIIFSISIGVKCFFLETIFLAEKVTMWRTTTSRQIFGNKEGKMTPYIFLQKYIILINLLFCKDFFKFNKHGHPVEIELTTYHTKISSVFEIAVARLTIFKVSISTFRFVFLFLHLRIWEGKFFV